MAWAAVPKPAAHLRPRPLRRRLPRPPGLRPPLLRPRPHHHPHPHPHPLTSASGTSARQAPQFAQKKAPSFGGAAKVPSWGGQAGGTQMGGAAGGGLDMNMLPPGGPLEMQKTAVGMLMFSPRDTGVGIYLDKYGEYGRDELDLLKQVIREGDVVVDAGAQYGVTALGLAQVVGPQGTVYAFEPQRVLHQTLCSNFAMNGATNCHCKRRLGSNRERL